MKLTQDRRRRAIPIVWLLASLLLIGCNRGAGGSITLRDTGLRFQHNRPVRSVVFSPSGEALFTASQDGIVRAWDLPSGALNEELRVRTGWASAVAVDPSGRSLSAGSHGGHVGTWNLLDWTLQSETTVAGDLITGVAFDPSGSSLAVAGLDGPIYIVDLADGDLAMQLSPGIQRTNWVAFSPDGSLLVTAHGGPTSESMVALLWDPTTGQELRALAGHSSPITEAPAPGLESEAVSIPGDVNSASFNSTGELVVTSGSDYTVRLWDALTGSQVVALAGPGAEVSWAAFVGSRSVVAATYWDGRLRVWDYELREVIAETNAATGLLLTGAVSLAGDLIATSDEHGVVRVWHVRFE